MISRQAIISSLKLLEKDPKVHACWLEGADAHKRADRFSDIDIWIDVSDSYVSLAFKKVEKLLSSFGDIDFSFERVHSHPKIRQRFYHIKGSSKFLVIDVCIQKHSRVFWYTTGYKDEVVVILFDKSNVIKYRKLNKARFKKDLQKRVSAIEESYSFFQVWVDKEMARGHFLQSLAAYQKYVLTPLVELIRIKYDPTKSKHHLSGISNDNVPSSIQKRLEDLYKIQSLADIKKKMKKANHLFEEVRKGIK